MISRHSLFEKRIVGLMSLIVDIGVVVGCSSSSSEATDGGLSHPDGSVSDAPVGDAGRAPLDYGEAGGNGLMPGDTTVNVPTDGGTMRSYLAHVPPTYDGRSAVPLLVLFHGLRGSGLTLSLNSGMSQKADSAGFVVAYPDGLANPGPFGTTSSWNAGVACCGDNDDVGFARQVVADVSSKVRIDPTHVYAAGFSYGAFFTQRLACEAGDLFAAFAPVSGVIDPGLPCNPSRPVALIEFHGTADPMVPYDGGIANAGSYVADAAPIVVPSAPDTFAGWAARDGCTGAPTETYRNNTAHCSTYASCSGGVKVTLCTIDGGLHCWPGAPSCMEDIVANDQIWTFVDGFALH